MRETSPLTGLSGNFVITDRLEARIRTGEPLAVAHADVDNFKAFNDHYGFVRGDDVIRFTARVLLAAAAACGEPDVFVGHIGGDDFAALLLPDQIDRFCKEAITAFDAGVGSFYDPSDAARGYIERDGRTGSPQQFPILTLSLGVATNLVRELQTAAAAATAAAETKDHAKRQHGSNYQVDRRRHQR